MSTFSKYTEMSPISLCILTEATFHISYLEMAAMHEQQSLVSCIYIYSKPLMDKFVRKNSIYLGNTFIIHM